MGLTLSMYVVYLHNIHHFSVGFATILLSLGAILGLITAPFWGTLTDRIGPAPTMLISGTASLIALVYWAFIHTKMQAIGGAAALAIFGGGGWGPGATMMSRLCPEEHRQRAFGFNFLLVNLGIGCGTLVSASIVDLHHPITFHYLYLLNAGITLVGDLVFLPLWRFGQVDTSAHHDPEKSTEGWGVVIRDRRLLQFVIASLVLMIGGYGSQEAGFSLFVVNNLHLSVHLIGVIFFFNTTTIVLAQLFMVNHVQGRSRMRMLASTAALWAIFWFILALSLHLPKAVVLIALCAAMVIFALGETLMSPIGSAFVNEIAPEHLRGRYNAASGLTWGLAGSLAPALTALYFDNGLGSWWPIATGITALVGGMFLLNLRRSLTPTEDGRVVSAEA
jgi:MFS family permease